MTSTRGSCIQAWPVATPSTSRSPSRRRISLPGLATSRVLGAVHQLAGREHLGQHRGDDLHRLDLVLAVGLGGTVLDREHADHVAAAQDGTPRKDR